MSVIGNPITLGGGNVGATLSGDVLPPSNLGNDGDIYIHYLPDGLNNGNSAYINTGYSGGNNSKYVIDFKVTKNQSSRWPTPFGARTAPNAVQNASSLHLAQSEYNYNGTILAWGSNEYRNAVAYSPSAEVGKRIKITVKAGLYTVEVDGQAPLSYSFSPSSISSTSPIGIFTFLINGSYDSAFQMDGMVLYSFEIYESDTLIHRFVPKVNGNTPCVYDEVSQTYNAGVGTFVFVPKGEIVDVYVKINGTWTELVGADISDVNV